MPEIMFSSHYGANAYFNMAIDEWMFGRAMATRGSIFLRLYSWDSPAITFGFNQNLETAFDHSRLGSTPAIRRITGGRALLHDPSELTYSLAVNTDGIEGPMVVDSASETSRAVAQILVDFLKRAGITSDYARQSSLQNSRPEFFHKAPCFASQARYEIMSGDRKIIASAQRRIDRTIFQHGSIKICGVAQHPAVTLGPEATKKPSGLAPLTTEKYRLLEPEFIRAFESHLNLQAVAFEPDESEQKQLQGRLLLVEKKCHDRRDIIKHN